MGKSKAKQKIILPPELPPETAEEDIEVSDEDLQFVNENPDFAGFVSRLDTQSINKYISRVANAKEDDLEASYEKRLLKKKKKEEEEEQAGAVRVQPLDSLPVKTLDGQLYYRTLPQTSMLLENGEAETEAEGNQKPTVNGVVKLSKAERRAKLKKLKKEAKMQPKEDVQPQQTPQAAVLAEVKEDLTAEEAFENKKRKLAELGMALLAAPDSNIKSLKEMLQLCRDHDNAIVKLGLLSLLAVFKDVIPGYRIRLPTEKELEMKVSKDVKKMRNYESTLLSSYKAYLQRLLALEKVSLYQHVVARCICTLLDAIPHFNFREILIEAVVRNMNSSDDVVRKLCCTTIKSLFKNEGKHGGEATVEAVRFIANQVKAHNCQMHPDSIEVFMSLSFDENLGKPEESRIDKKVKEKKGKNRKAFGEPKNMQENDRKKSKQELIAKMREEVAADYKAAAFAPDVVERRRMQSEALSSVFETYFRILKHTTQLIAPRVDMNTGSLASISEGHPLLAPCLSGLGKFSHLIDLDYIGDLMNYLKRLAGASGSDGSLGKCLTVSERLRCCIVAFKVMRNNLDALNVDLQDFFVQLYNLILEYRPGRDQGEVLAEALKMMLCDDKQHDMQKAAAFIKRLATFSLCFCSAESMAALVTLKHLLQKNAKCRVLLENDPGGGSASGSIAKYQPYASDPNQSGALASVLWELDLLSKHYHPAISTMASGISNMSVAPNQAYLSILSPQQAFLELSLEQESFNLKGPIKKARNKRKRGSAGGLSTGIKSIVDVEASFDEDELQKKLSEHFTLLNDIKENERLSAELDRTTFALKLYEDYKQQKRRRVLKTQKSKKR